MFGKRFSRFHNVSETKDNDFTLKTEFLTKHIFMH